MDYKDIIKSLPQTPWNKVGTYFDTTHVYFMEKYYHHHYDSHLYKLILLSLVYTDEDNQLKSILNLS